MATKKSTSLWAIGLWTVVMILALSGAAISIVFMTLEANYLLCILGLVAGSGFFVYSLKKIIANDQSWKISMKEEIKAETSDILAAWTYPLDLWEGFVEQDVASKKKESLQIAITMLIMVAIGLGIGAWNAADDLETFLKIAIPLLIGLTAIAWYGSRYNINHLRKVYLQLSEGQTAPGVLISIKGIVVNDFLLTAFKFFGGRLSAVKQVDKFEQSCLRFSIYMKAGRNSSTKNFYLPVLAHQQEEARALVQTLQSHYDLPAD